MSQPLEDLEKNLISLREELARVSRKLKDMERVLNVGTDHQGQFSATLECSEIILRRFDESGAAGLRLGLDPAGRGQMQIGDPSSDHAALELGMQDDGNPHLSLMGDDGELRAQLFVTEDCGGLSTHAKGGRAGTLTRAQPQGGSVAVLQADGTARGVLLHIETEEPHEGDEPNGYTEILFGDGHGHAALKLRTDSKTSLFSMSSPDHSDAAVLIAQEGGAALMMHSQDQENHASVVAMDGMTQICVHEGSLKQEGYSATLSASSDSCGLALHGKEGKKAVDLSAIDAASAFSLHDEEGNAQVMLSHNFESHSSFNMKSPDGHEGLRAITSNEISSMEISSSEEPETKIITAVASNKPVTIMQKQSRPLVMMGEGDQGGTFCAYGKDPDSSGIASLSGGRNSGHLTIATPDGSPQVSIDATGYGGQLCVFSDLGFVRARLTVLDEGAGLFMNNTGKPALQAVASSDGGRITAFDSQTNIAGVFPEDQNSSKDWDNTAD
jgi:hypothetical protein